MNKQRPVNLDLFTIKFPITAIISILHRISGVLLFLLIPLVLWMLSKSLGDPIKFTELQLWLGSPFVKLILWGLLAALLYHLIAGIRHIIMDMGWGEELTTARKSARWIIITAVVLIFLAGIWLW